MNIMAKSIVGVIKQNPQLLKEGLLVIGGLLLTIKAMTAKKINLNFRKQTISMDF